MTQGLSQILANKMTCAVYVFNGTPYSSIYGADVGGTLFVLFEAGVQYASESQKARLCCNSESNHTRRHVNCFTGSAYMMNAHNTLTVTEKTPKAVYAYNTMLTI